jgi:hypothetical protein
VKAKFEQDDWKIDGEKNEKWSMKLCTRHIVKSEFNLAKKGKYKKQDEEWQDKHCWMRMKNWAAKTRALAWKIKNKAYHHWIIGPCVCCEDKDINVDHILISCKKLISDDSWIKRMGVRSEKNMNTLVAKRREGSCDADIIEQVDWGIANIRWQIWWKIFFKVIDSVPNMAEQEQHGKEMMELEETVEVKEWKKEEWRKINC